MPLALRSAGPDDVAHIRWALYAAVSWDPGREIPPYDAAIGHPQLVIYHRGWMRPGDLGLIAEDGERVVGVAFCRVFTEGEHGHGYVDEQTPEIALAVTEGYRGAGLGARLLAGLAEDARRAGFRRLSLSVDRENPARRLYARSGYRAVSEDQSGVRMLLDLTEECPGAPAVGVTLPVGSAADRAGARRPGEGVSTFTTAMPAREYYGHLLAGVEARPDLAHAVYPLAYRAGTWDFLRISSRRIAPDDKVMVIRATIHGDETAGALTVLNHLDELVDYAHGRGIKLIVYPLGNPSGFERGIRYNADNHVGEGNNDFLRYVMEDGSLEGDLGTGKPFRSWVMADEPTLGLDLPAETRLMLELVRRDPLEQVVAALDLHQDVVTAGLPACAYHYAFGDLRRYPGIVARVAEVVPLLSHYEMAGGFGEQVDEDGRLLPRARELAVRSDADGFIIRYDGSFSDFYQRIGVAHSIAPETTGATPIEDACRVNLIWITGVIDLVAAGR